MEDTNKYKHGPAAIKNPSPVLDLVLPHEVGTPVDLKGPDGAGKEVEEDDTVNVALAGSDSILCS